MTSSPSEAESLPCPRCNSRDTKFCYFNNYSTTQPRHFCKNCKRYWTAGGSLRNVPVGGGLRKSKKSKLSRHGKDLLSASSEEFLNSSKPATSLPLASPTSSADGVVDEAFANPVVPLLAYRPTFEFASESLLQGDYNSNLPTSHPFPHMNMTQSSEDHGNALFATSHYQLRPDDARNGFHHPQNWYGSMDQAHCNHGEISTEPSQEGHRAAVFAIANTGHSALQRYQDLERKELKAQTGLRQIVDESNIFCKQGNAQCSLEEQNMLSHDGILKNLSPTEDEDEGLGNVINVRYPYDWEQVSEVLFGGTPDFFQMPTF